MDRSYHYGNIASTKKVTILGATLSCQYGDYVSMQNRLREIRKSLELSGERLAEIAGTTKATISRLEKGERRLSDHWIERIVKGLHKAGFKDIRPSDFFEGGNPIEQKLNLVPEEKRKQLKDLYDMQQKNFEAMVDSLIKEQK